MVRNSALLLTSQQHLKDSCIEIKKTEVNGQWTIDHGLFFAKI